MVVRWEDESLESTDAMNTTEPITNNGGDKLLKAVRHHFSFLLDEGFDVRSFDKASVVLGRNDIEVTINHDRLSYEIGVEISHRLGSYSIGEIIYAADPQAGDAYRDFAATDEAAVGVGLEAAADNVRRFGRGVIDDDSQALSRLAFLRRQRTNDFAREVKAAQVRPKAEEAFRRRQYSDVIALYESIASLLTPSERKRLEIAKREYADKS